MADFATIGFRFDTTGLKQAERGMDSMAAKGERSEKRINKSTSSAADGFMKLAKVVGTTLATFASFSKLTQITREFDILNAQLVTATGSMDNASKAFKSIQDFAAKTPYDLAQVTNSFTKLVNLGLKPSERALTSYGNTAAAMGKNLNQLIEAVADAATGEFERLKEFGIKAKSQGDNVSFTFRGITTTVKKEASQIEDYLMALGENEFAGAMSQRVDTLDGAMSNLGDSWDKLFLNVSQMGVGDEIEKQVRASISALDDLNLIIESGQMQAGIDLIAAKFSVFGDDISKTMEDATGIFITDVGFWNDTIDNFIKLSKDALFNFPENMRAAIKLATLNLYDIVTAGKTVFTAFGEVIGVRLGELVLKVGAYGEAIGQALNPFSDGSFDLDAELMRLGKISVEMTNEILSNSQSMTDTQLRLRAENIASILKERDIAILASNEQIKSIEDMGDAYKKLLAERKASGDDVLASFGLSPASSTNSTLKKMEVINDFSIQVEESIKRLDETFVDVWMGVFDGFESVTDKIINSFKQMLAEMAHAALTRPIVMQIGAAMGLGGASGMANAASGLGNIASLGGVLSGLTSGIVGLGSSIASLGGVFGSLGVGIGGTGALLGAGSVSGAMANIGGLFAGGNIAAGIGAALPIAGIAAAALTVVDKIAGGGLFGTSFKAKDTTLNLGFSGGDATGSTTLLETKKRSLFRGTKKRETETGLDLSAIDSIFDSVQTSIIEAAELLDITEVTQTITHGFGNLYEKFGESFERYFDATSITTTQTVEEYLNNFSASFSKSIKDMSEEEVQQAIADWTNRTTEQMINAVFGGMVGEFKKEGETSAQTIDRLVINLKAVGSVTDTLGLAFELTGTEAARASTNIVELVGGLDSLNAFTTSYYNEFFNQQEKMASLTNDLNDSFESMNINMPQTRDGFRALVEGLDLTTESGQEMFAMLMQLVPGMDAYFDALENGQAEALNTAMAVLQDSINIEKARAAEILNAAKDIYNATKESIELEEERAAAILQSARDAYSATIANIEAQRTAILEQKSLAESALSSAGSALSASFNAEKNKIQELSNARISAIADSARLEQELIRESSNQRISGLNDEISALSGRQSSLSSIVSSMNSLANRLSSTAGSTGGTIAEALAAARRGDFSQAEALSGDLPNASGFSSAADFRVAQATAKNQLKAISDLATGRASGAQAQINALESMKSLIELQIEQEKESADNLIEQSKTSSDLLIEQEQTSTEEQLAALDNQYNELVGIDTNILSLSDAIAQYQDAQLALEALNTDSVLEELTKQEDAAMSLLDVAEQAYEDEIARLDEMLDNAQSTLDLAEQAYEDEIARLDSILESAQMQIDILNGISENTLSATQALEALIAVIQVASEPSTPDETSDPVTGGATGNNAVTEATLQTISTNMAKTAQILQDMQLDGLDTRVVS